MNGLRFESMADMPPRMREAYARQVFPKAPAQQAAAKYHNAPAEPGSGLTARRRRGGTTS